MRAPLRPEPPLERRAPVAHHLRVGPAARGILELADELRVDLMIMGMKNRPDADTFGTGAVSQRVIEHTSCPVIGVRPGTPSAASAIPQIVCPVHLWETWRRGLDAAFALTRSFGAGSVVLNIASRAGKATTDEGASLDER